MNWQTSGRRISILEAQVGGEEVPTDLSSIREKAQQQGSAHDEHQHLHRTASIFTL